MDDLSPGKLIKGTGTFMKLFAGLSGAESSEETGEAILRARRAEAASLMRRAKSERAIGNRLAHEEHRKAEKVSSDFDAQAAASGTGGPQIEKLAADIAAEGDYRKRVALFGQEEVARGLEDLAKMKEFEGHESARAGSIKAGAKRTAAVATLLELFEDTSLFDKFGEDDDEDELELT